MNIFEIFTNWKEQNLTWQMIEPFVLKLTENNVPARITKIYENLAKFTQPVLDSLFKLKEKVNQTPNTLDNYCFKQGVNAIEVFANYLLGIVEDLRK